MAQPLPATTAAFTPFPHTIRSSQGALRLGGDLDALRRELTAEAEHLKAIEKACADEADPDHPLN